MVVILLKMQISKIEVPINLTLSTGTGCYLCKFEYFRFSGYCGEVANVSGKKNYNAVVAFFSYENIGTYFLLFIKYREHIKLHLNCQIFYLL